MALDAHADGPADTAANTPDVVSVGDVIHDAVIPYDAMDDDLRAADWLPAAGESAVVDTVPDTAEDYVVETNPGGRAPNQAVAAAQSGADTRFYGKQAPGSDATAVLADCGVDLAYLETDAAKERSVSYVFVDDAGENRIAFTRGANSVLDDAYLDACFERYGAADADYLLLNNGEPDAVLDYVLETVDALDDGPDVVFDPVPVAGAADRLDHDAIAYVTPNEHEYAALEDALDDYDGTVVRTGADAVVVEQPVDVPDHTGYAPASVVDGSYRVETPDVEPVDTTGAGDTFNGYLAGCLAQGMDERTAVEYATVAASLSVTEDGVQRAVPAFSDVAAFLDG